MQDVILIGDSIRIGYQGEATNGLADVAYVWGPDENCRDSNNVLGQLDHWVLKRDCDVLHLNCGLHDIKRAKGGEVNQVPLEKYRENLTRIFQRIRDAKPDTTIIWATTTPVIERLHNAERDFDRYEQDVADYNAAAREIARSFGLLINDLHGVVERADKGKILLNDGVHYTDDGYRILGEEVAACIHPLLPDRD